MSCLQTKLLEKRCQLVKDCSYRVQRGNTKGEARGKEIKCTKYIGKSDTFKDEEIKKK